MSTACHKFSTRAREFYISSIVDFTATLTLGYFFGLVGLGVAAIIRGVIPVWYLATKVRVRVPMRIDLPRLKSLVKVGLPYSFLDTVFYVGQHASILLLAVLAGATAAGHFALSVLILEFSRVVAQLGVGQVVKPHLLREFGRDGSITAVAEYYEAPSRLFSYALPPVIGVASVLMPELVERFLPHYVEGVAAAQVMLWSIFFVTLHATVQSMLAELDRELFPKSTELLPEEAWQSVKAGLPVPR
ncbi:MAG: hypothetical protein GY953_32075, partial [bacterium]|nr:hypothetical protein [bacterium]